MHEALEGLSPAELWHHFSELSAIPRPSGSEQACQLYVKGLADAAGVRWAEDQMGNLVLYLDGDSGPVVAIQTHFDMVCEQVPGLGHDFSRDPIRLVRDGDRIFARGTTLGADNGIGAAAALALLTQPGIARPPLELIFTVQEETGLHGAVGFDPALSSAEMLINLDSEDPDTLTVGCSGGSAVEIIVPLEAEEAPAGWSAYRITVAGAQGGHSGVSIHERRVNAIKILLQALIAAEGVGFRLAEFEGGSAHNVIPRDAWAVVHIPAADAEELTEAVMEADREVCKRWGTAEPKLRLTIEQAPSAGEVLSPASSDKLLKLLADLPHGVLAMSKHFKGKVETSTNLAKVEATAGSARILASVRSFVPKKQLDTRLRLEKLGTDAGGSIVIEMGYPGWEPDPSSKLARLTQEQFAKVNGREPIVEVLHAGLECGVLVAKKPGMQAISFGPLITGAHSPSETVTATTVEAMWQLLVGLLGALRGDS